MKIAYIVNIRIPTEKAHGYQICKMCEEFSRQGAQVELWVPIREGYIKDDAFFFYGLKNNFTIKKIDSSDFYKYLEYPGKLSFWLQSFLFILQLAFIKVDKEAIIYTRNPEISWIFNLRGYQTVYEAHTWPENRKWLYVFLIKKSNKIITITDGLRKLFLKNNWPDNKILVAPDGVDLEKFDIDVDRIQARKKMNLPPDKKIILYTGHLYSWKGADDLAKAANLLGDDCLVIFVGGVKTDVDAFIKRNKKLVDDGKISFRGQQPHGLIPIWLKAADVLVLPNKSQENISKYFTSPLKLFEYMASRRPIVASDLPSIKEVLDKSNCVFFDSDNPEDLADKIKLVFSGQVLAEKIAEQAYQDVKKYTWEERAKKIIAFIN